MLGIAELTDTHLELMLGFQWEESLEWRAQLGRRHTGWHELTSVSQLVGLVQMIGGEGDWFTAQTRGEAPRRYAQAMNTGSGYLVEVAQVDGGITRNWRIGLGVAADNAGNLPFSAPTQAQNLIFAAVVEVLISWFRGSGLPLGYGAALRIYG
ncbi:hypothetical protein [Arthrobacter sp. N1]|uniref:hypothetical protein n=1 Tax=Arthrobacter sp. N1 TaxID=619291 RepID=UPI003BB0D660